MASVSMYTGAPVPVDRVGGREAH